MFFFTWRDKVTGSGPAELNADGSIEIKFAYLRAVLARVADPLMSLIRNL